MSSSISIDQYDAWLQDGSTVAALVMCQWLVPVEGKGAVIFPPTYATPETNEKVNWLGYNIDRFDDGSTICQIDSVGSQANRMEPIFKRGPYDKLVPQIVIGAKETKVNLLDAGHRAADAIVRFSSIKAKLESAFLAVLNHGNMIPLAKIAPTSIVFGSWDSRSTQVKLPRIVRSVIRAFQVDVLHRSAQYTPPVRYVNAGLVEAPAGESQQKALSQEGLNDNPSTWKHGGVRVRVGGEVRRDATLNLVAIRALGSAPTGNNEKVTDDTMKLRRYILGLALVAFTAPQDTFLREGCQLVPDVERSARWELVSHDGQRAAFGLTHNSALEYANSAAEAFGVGEDHQANFLSDMVKTELAKSKDERKAQRRQKPTEVKDEV